MAPALWVVGSGGTGGGFRPWRDPWRGRWSGWSRWWWGEGGARARWRFQGLLVVDLAGSDRASPGDGEPQRVSFRSACPDCANSFHQKGSVGISIRATSIAALLSKVQYCIRCFPSMASSGKGEQLLWGLFCGKRAQSDQ